MLGAYVYNLSTQGAACPQPIQEQGVLPFLQFNLEHYQAQPSPHPGTEVLRHAVNFARVPASSHVHSSHVHKRHMIHR